MKVVYAIFLVAFGAAAANAQNWSGAMMKLNELPEAIGVQTGVIISTAKADNVQAGVTIAKVLGTAKGQMNQVIGGMRQGINRRTLTPEQVIASFEQMQNVLNSVGVLIDVPMSQLSQPTRDFVLEKLESLAAQIQDIGKDVADMVAA